MLIDAFTYFDEDLICDLRFNILNEIVDKFLIVEAGTTHQGNRKSKNFNINNFPKFKNKIDYLFVENLPNSNNPWLLESTQRNYLRNLIDKYDDEDFVMISDVDEIPNPKKIVQAYKNKFSVFEQDLFYYKINLKNFTEPKWLGTKICKKKFIDTPQNIRTLKYYPRWRIDKKYLKKIIDGGWHFSFLKSPDDISKKIKSYAHKEFNLKKFVDTSSIKKKIQDRKDLFDRDVVFNAVNLDKKFPNYILTNLEKYKDFIV